mmetsp:Transcript_55462/g.154578  ORF Transcript_55462/g.154578 Transcript_55462/m.154578 type:complete len:272 (+) Transcript_55462:291-1106(+)
MQGIDGHRRTLARGAMTQPCEPKALAHNATARTTMAARGRSPRAASADSASMPSVALRRSYQSNDEAWMAFAVVPCPLQRDAAPRPATPRCSSAFGAVATAAFASSAGSCSGYSGGGSRPEKRGNSAVVRRLRETASATARTSSFNKSSKNPSKSSSASTAASAILSSPRLAAALIKAHAARNVSAKLGASNRHVTSTARLWTDVSPMRSMLRSAVRDAVRTMESGWVAKCAICTKRGNPRWSATSTRASMQSGALSSSRRSARLFPRATK